jgi:hypothetical protein
VPVKALAKLVGRKLRAGFATRRPDLVLPAAAWAKPWVVQCTAWGHGEQGAHRIVYRRGRRKSSSNEARSTAATAPGRSGPKRGRFRSLVSFVASGKRKLWRCRCVRSTAGPRCVPASHSEPNPAYCTRLKWLADVCEGRSSGPHLQG